MNKNHIYLKNPVAKQMLEGYYSDLFENEKVDALLKKISDNALNTFKILTFDLAPKRDRKPDVVRTKLAKLADSKTVSSLAATMQDLAEDNELANSRFSEAKRLYLEALSKFGEALKRSHEINKSKDEVILKIFKLAPSKIQNVIDGIAKEELERQKKEEAELKESYSFSDQEILESIFTGYRGRVENLKKNLTNLITSAEGKDQKSGYGRDWKRTFLDLDEKRKALDISGGGFGKKDKDDLGELEKQVEKFQTEFNNALVQAANRSLQQLEDDEELYSSFSDVTSLLGSGLDYLTRAYAQNKIAIQEIRAEHEEEENIVGKSVFPLKRGDTDSDKKIKNSGLIYSIQTALCNGIPAAKKLIASGGGPNGKYGPATQAVVATIQKLAGNKNTNGEMDKALLDDIMSSDWVASKDKQAIEKSLSTIRSKINEGYSPLVGIDSFINPLNEDKILLNKSEFEKELDSQYKTIVGDAKSKEVVESPDGGGSSDGVKKLAKSLRQKYSLKIESEDFLKNDGSLKSSYSPQFIKAWSESIDKVGDEVNDYSYFYFSGGVYNINISSSSLKNPCNWKKWSDMRSLSDLGDEDAVDFLTNYLKGWVTFGMIRPQFRFDGIKKLINENSENDDLELANVYEMMEGSIINKGIPYIPYDNLKGEISKAFKIVTQKEEKSPDLGKEEFVAINNFLVMIANAVSFDGSKMISCIKWIHDNVLGESTAKRVAKDSIVSFVEDDRDSGRMLGYKSSSIIVDSADEIADRKIQVAPRTSDDLSGFNSLIDLNTSSSSIKKALGKNCYYIANDIYPSIKLHVKRMNATSFEDVPQNKPFKCMDSKL